MQLTCINYTQSSEFTEGNGVVPSILPDYFLTQDDVLFGGTADFMTNAQEESIRYKILLSLFCQLDCRKSKHLILTLSRCQEKLFQLL